jgi:hypothetical protein
VRLHVWLPRDVFDSSDAPKKRARNATPRAKKNGAKNDSKVHDAGGYEMMEEAQALMPAKSGIKWWNREKTGDPDVQWETLVHNGVIFPPPYEPHGIKMLYDGAARLRARACGDAHMCMHVCACLGRQARGPHPGAGGGGNVVRCHARHRTRAEAGLPQELL